MSAILKFALCPAPFQPKNKKDKKKKGTCPEPPLQHVLTDTFSVPQFVETPVTTNGRLHTRQQPSADSPRSSTSSNGTSNHHQPQPLPATQFDSMSVRSGRSTHFTSSGYQSDYNRSGYVTDGGEGAFESQLLQRATRERPANLRMTAVRDYVPCCNEELPVRKGQRVKVLYKNHDWVFAVTKHGQSGFLPFSYVRPSRKYSGYQSEPEITRIDEPYASGYDTDIPPATSRPYPATIGSRKHQPAHQSYSINTGYHRTGSGSPIQARVDFDSGYLSAFESSPSQYPPSHRRSPPSRSFRPSTIKPAINSFNKCYLEELVVIHDFEAMEEDEVMVFKGERVQVLNADDCQWLWIATLQSHREGFVPRSCCTLGNHPALSTPNFTRPSHSRHTSGGRHHHHGNSSAQRNLKMQARDKFRQLAQDRSTTDPTKVDKEIIKKVGTKLIVLMDYEATCDEELTLEFSESVIADILTQTGSERIWVYCPRTDQCGFVPMSMVVPPVV